MSWSRSAAGDYKEDTNRTNRKRLEALWRFKIEVHKSSKAQKKTYKKLEHKPVWIQVRGGLLGQDFWSTGQRSQPVLWPIKSQSTDNTESQSTDNVQSQSTVWSQDAEDSILYLVCS